MFNGSTMYKTQPDNESESECDIELKSIERTSDIDQQLFDVSNTLYVNSAQPSGHTLTD